MSRLMKACLRCGHEGSDVRTTLVEYDDPIDVQVSIPTDATRSTFETRTVPGRWGAEWRCRDQRACDERLEAIEAASRPVAVLASSEPDSPAAEEVPPWL